MERVAAIRQKRDRLLPSLDELTRYENEDVINGFTKAYDVSEKEARRIFKEMLKWLWLSNESSTFQYANVELMGIDDPLAIIDEM